MSNSITNRIIKEVLDGLDIPDSAYETAKKRYEDLGDWFKRPEAHCYNCDPHIYPQGSFRLGTVIRPLHPEAEYDLDLGCRLRAGITKATFTQKQLKQLVGVDLEEYRIARNIKEEMEEMHRCWRLKYADTLPFHMDSVPSIPESISRKQFITEAMVRSGISESLAKAVTEFTGAITDNRHEHYTVISDDWRISNSEGYARWFEFRMKLARVLLENRAFAAQMTTVDQLPIYQWKSPLQRCVQILKRHRDVMYEEKPDSKPISIIITTLAAASYQGETEIDDALDRILSTMGSLINPTSPRVPNPVNPAEDFADKWGDSKYQHLQLEQNFWLWLEQAKADFRTLRCARSADLIVEQAKHKFGVNIGLDGLEEKLGLGAVAISVTPKTHIITEVPAKPWCRADD